MNISQAIKEQIIMLASFAGREMNEMLLNGYMEAVSDLDQEQVLDTLKSWLRTNKGFPHPADIRAKVMPELNPEDNAQDAANLAIACVSRYGYTNPEKARASMGELAWAVVHRMGGWQHLCETLNNQNEGMFRAQIRNLAEVVSKKSKRGELDIAPALPEPTNNVTSLISKTMTKPGEVK